MGSSVAWKATDCMGWRFDAMSIRITTDSWLVPERNDYGNVRLGHQVDMHVFTTITHDHVGLDLVQVIENGPTIHVDNFYLVLSNEDAERLVTTLTSAIESNHASQA